MEKKYDVYGIGNALVDMEFEVSDDFFHQHQIEKGFMTLVDEERQNYLMSNIQQDEVKKQGGGSAANSIIGVSQFGGKCFYSCKVANDPLGKFYLQDLKRSKVDTNLDNDNLSEGITGKCLVMVTPDAERTMNTFLGITSTLSINEIDEESLKASKYIYIEGYLVSSPEGLKAMMEVRRLASKHGIKTSLTFSDPSMVKYFKDGLKEVIGDGLDLLFCNEEEALTFTDSNDLATAQEKLKKLASTFVITRGKNGALVFDGTTFIDIAPYTAQAVDTNGAGDMFAGAFLYGLTQGHDYALAGKLASLASSKVVSKFGPRLERHQAEEILNQVFH